MDDIQKLTKWVWLATACGAGSSLPDTLVSAFGDVESIYEATEEDFLDLDVKIPCLGALCDKSTERAARIVKWCEMKKVGILTIDDPRYPRKLYETQSYPAVLYYYGRIPEIDNRLAVACVGTRNITEYGRRNAYAITRDLAKEGAVIVSGLALGIDAICHRAALDVDGDTIAVLGCGLDRAYPPQNRDLMVEIARKGVIFTEYVPFTEPTKTNFPLRNRIISGLSDATVVFEADEHSGSLITARHAKRQGRPIYALPGNNGMLSSLGTNELLTNGARAVTKAGDILEDFKEYKNNSSKSSRNARAKVNAEQSRNTIRNAEMVAAGLFAKKPDILADVAAPTPAPEAVPEEPPKPSEPLSKEKADKLKSELSLLESTVYNALSKTKPKTSDELTETGYPINKILAALTMLEIKKLILSMPGGGYVRV